MFAFFPFVFLYSLFRATRVGVGREKGRKDFFFRWNPWSLGDWLDLTIHTPCEGIGPI
jgi:hypothetical protein